jgi:hypothetical protein
LHHEVVGAEPDRENKMFVRSLYSDMYMTGTTTSQHQEELQVTNYKVQQEQVKTKNKLQGTRYKLQLTSYKLQGTTTGEH